MCNSKELFILSRDYNFTIATDRKLKLKLRICTKCFWKYLRISDAFLNIRKNFSTHRTRDVREFDIRIGKRSSEIGLEHENIFAIWKIRISWKFLVASNISGRPIQTGWRTLGYPAISRFPRTSGYLRTSRFLTTLGFSRYFGFPEDFGFSEISRVSQELWNTRQFRNRHSKFKSS